MSKHTPGKWTVERGEDDGGALCYEVWSEGTRLTYVCGDDEGLPPEQAKANAALLAAAPELLAACKAALTVVEDCFDGVDDAFKDSVDVKLRAAIAKAEGGAK